MTTKTAPCPVCGLESGFHDHDDKNSKHVQHQVPQHLLKESGWVHEAHEKLTREKKLEEQEYLQQLLALDVIHGYDYETEGLGGT